MEKNVVSKDECITQGDCVVCGAKEVKGRLDNFPVCYDCYSSGKGTKWVIKTSTTFLEGKGEVLDTEHLSTLSREQQAKLLTELCKKYIEIKEV